MCFTFTHNQAILMMVAADLTAPPSRWQTPSARSMFSCLPTHASHGHDSPAHVPERHWMRMTMRRIAVCSASKSSATGEGEVYVDGAFV